MVDFVIPSVTSSAAAIDWQFDHTLEVSNRALENLVTVHLGDTSYVISASFYDQSEALLKYHGELEVRDDSTHANGK